MLNRSGKTAVTIIALAIIILVLSFAVTCQQKADKKSAAKAVITGKTAAPITIRYQLPDRAEIGREIPVIIECRADSDVQDLSLKITAPQGLDLVPAVIEQEFGDQPANFTGLAEVTVIPREEGVLYLNVFASGLFGGLKMVRTSAVPVRVGKSSRKHLQSVGQEKTTDTGEKIISMPAKEK